MSFESVLDREIGRLQRCQVKSVVADNAPFRVEHDPGNPAADDNGNVKLPNVNMLIEMADMREASRSYEANLQMMKQVRNMFSTTIDLLRSALMIDPCLRHHRAAVTRSNTVRVRGAAAATASSGADFGSVLANIATSAVDTLKAGEAAAISGLKGKASMQEVVQAVMSAEQPLQTALAIRDKVVSAYQEISRMQI